MEILRGMEVKITGVIHRLIFLKKNFKFFFNFFFFFFGGGGYLCKLFGGHAPPPQKKNILHCTISPDKQDFLA